MDVTARLFTWADRTLSHGRGRVWCGPWSRFEVGFKQSKLKKNIPGRERSIRKYKKFFFFFFFFLTWNHSVSPEHQEWGWGRWWQRFRRRKSEERDRGQAVEDFKGWHVSLHPTNTEEPLTCFVSFHQKEGWGGPSVRDMILFQCDGSESSGWRVTEQSWAKWELKASCPWSPARSAVNPGGSPARGPEARWQGGPEEERPPGRRPWGEAERWCAERMVVVKCGKEGRKGMLRYKLILSFSFLQCIGSSHLVSVKQLGWRTALDAGAVFCHAIALFTGKLKRSFSWNVVYAS